MSSKKIIQKAIKIIFHNKATALSRDIIALLSFNSLFASINCGLSVHCSHVASGRQLQCCIFDTFISLYISSQISLYHIKRGEEQTARGEERRRQRERKNNRAHVFKPFDESRHFSSLARSFFFLSSSLRALMLLH
jgi:hypothetical protein